MLMTNFEKKEGYLGSFAKDFIISKTAVYRWVKKYKDELTKAGIIKEKRRGKQRIVYVYDIDKFVDFFRERDIILVDEDED